MLRVSAGAAVAAGTLALVPTPSGAQFQQTLTITKAVEGTPGDEEFDFLVDCAGESTGVEFTLADGESIVLEEESDLGVTFSAGIECVILEREGDDPPDEVEASGEFETIDPQDTGAPVGRAIETLDLTEEEAPDGYVAMFSFTTQESRQVIGYTVDVVNIYQAPPPSSSTSSSTTSSSTTSTTQATTTTAAVATTATPRFTG